MMLDEERNPQDPPPPPGFVPVEQGAQDTQTPPPPAGFEPVGGGDKVSDLTLTDLVTGKKPYTEDPAVANFKREHPWVAPVVTGAQGVGSGIFKTLHGLDTLGTKGWAAISGQPEQPNIIPESWTQTPPGIAGSIGHGAEQLGEFFLPSGWIGKADKAIEAAKLPYALELLAKGTTQAVPAAGITYAQTGGDAKAAAIAGGVAGGFGAVLPFAAKWAKHWLGKRTGVGVEAIEKAVQGSPEFEKGLIGQVTEADILNTAREGLEAIKEGRRAAYVADLQKLPKNLTLNLKPARADFLNSLRGHNITYTIDPKTYQPVLDFSRSAVKNDATGMKALQDTATDLWEWGSKAGDLTPHGVDNLKRIIDGRFSPKMQGRAAIEATKNSVRDILNRVPGYQRMTQGYAEASDLLDNIADLSLGSKNDGTAIRKLTTILNQNNGYRSSLLDALSKYAGVDIGAQIAGNRMSTWAPRGIAGPLQAAGMFSAHGLATLLGAATFSSPRAVARVVQSAAKVGPYIPRVGGALPGMLHISGRQPNYDQNAGQNTSEQNLSDYYGAIGGKAHGGKVNYDDGGGVDNEVLNDIKRRHMIQLGENPGQFWQQPISVDPERSMQQLFGGNPAPSRPMMGPPQAPPEPITSDASDTSYSTAISRANPMPEWYQQTAAAVNQPFAMPTTGGSPMSLADIYQMPESKGEAGLMAAMALIPPAKALKGAKKALKLGTTLAEGAAPEAGILSRALENAPRTDITAQEIFEEAAKEKGKGSFPSYSKYIERNPTAGEGLFDTSNAQPSLPGRPSLPRYDPSTGRGRGPSARVVDAFNNPKVLEGLPRYIREGAEQLPENWYANDPLFKVYQQEWGPLAEEKFFKQMGYQAATSTGSSVPNNIRTGSLYTYLDEQGLPFPPKVAPAPGAKPKLVVPKGYGSKYQVAHHDTAVNFRDTGGIDPLANPKRASFTENLMGNEDWLTEDKHFMRLVGMLSEDPRFLKTTAEVSRNGKNVIIKPQKLFKRGKLTMEQALDDPNLWVEAPNPNEYLYLENQFRDKISKPMNYTVADAQGKAWVGGGEMTGLGSPPETWINLVRKRVQYTADRLNVDPQVILRKWVRGEIPLLQLGAAAAGLGALTSMGQGEGQGAAGEGQNTQLRAEGGVLRLSTGGSIQLKDGGSPDDDDDPVLQNLLRRRMTQLGHNPGQLRQQLITIDPERAQQQLFGDDYQAPPRPKMGPPEAPPEPISADASGADTSFSDTMSRANPNPEWAQRASAAVNQPFSMPTTGGPPMNPMDVIQIPQTKTDVALQAAGALLPFAGKALKGAKGTVDILRRPRTLTANTQLETTTGTAANHLLDTASEPYSQKQALTESMIAPAVDDQGRDILGAGLKTGEMQSGVGAYKSPGSNVTQVNPVRSLPAKVRIVYDEAGNASVDPEAMARLRARGGMYGLAYGQEGVGINVLKRNPEGVNIEVPMEKPVTPDVMKQLAAKYPNAAFADTRKNVQVLDLSELSGAKGMTKFERDDIQRMLNAPGYKRTENLGDYLDFVDQWKQGQGSQAVTRKVVDLYDQQNARGRALMDREIQQFFGGVLESYQQAIKARPNMPVNHALMNVVSDLSTKGVAGVKAALAKAPAGSPRAANYPGLIGAAMLPLFRKQLADQGSAETRAFQ